MVWKRTEKKMRKRERGIKEKKKKLLLSPSYMPGSVLCILPVLSHLIVIKTSTKSTKP